MNEMQEALWFIRYAPSLKAQWKALSPIELSRCLDVALRPVLLGSLHASYLNGFLRAKPEGTTFTLCLSMSLLLR